ncbi:MAG: NIPSNAP family protein [Armatimonadota bacterium]
MYKRVIRSEVLYGKFREFRKAIDSLDDLAKRKGLAPARSYVLEFGQANVAIAEWEYADFAQYERDRKTYLQDEELRNAWQATIPYIVQGSLHEELWIALGV